MSAIIKACCYGNSFFVFFLNYGIDPSNHHTKFEIFRLYCWFCHRFVLFEKQMLGTLTSRCTYPNPCNSCRASAVLSMKSIRHVATSLHSSGGSSTRNANKPIGSPSNSEYTTMCHAFLTFDFRRRTWSLSIPCGMSFQMLQDQTPSTTKSWHQQRKLTLSTTTTTTKLILMIIITDIDWTSSLSCCLHGKFIP